MLLDARRRCARLIERGAAEGRHPACCYLWLSAWLACGCAFAGVCACGAGVGAECFT